MQFHSSEVVPDITHAASHLGNFDRQVVAINFFSLQFSPPYMHFLFLHNVVVYFCWILNSLKSCLLVLNWILISFDVVIRKDIVKYNGDEVHNLNELEFIDREVWANVWQVCPYTIDHDHFFVRIGGFKGVDIIVPIWVGISTSAFFVALV